MEDQGVLFSSVAEDPEMKMVPPKIIAKFTSLGARGWEYKGMSRGPVVTAFYFEPHISIPLRKIMGAADDLALTLKVQSVQISREAGTIVVYVPNKQREEIDFKNLLTWAAGAELNKDMQLPMVIGVDYHGHPAALDLALQPHCLICGMTGAGKSVFQSNLIASLAVLKPPSELQFHLVDTKRLDLPLFRGLKHVKSISTTLIEYLQLMNELLSEHFLRVEEFARRGARNIYEYNHLMLGMGTPVFCKPYIVVVIDEMADLFDQDFAMRKAEGKDGALSNYLPADKSLKRLAQVARASGIHLICGTQRSSVKIVDGDIKVNLPTRIALRLPTNADSRTILGEGGAEYLLGRGDMLIQTAESETPTRYHGPFVKREDISWVVDNAEYLAGMFKDMVDKRRVM